MPVKVLMLGWELPPYNSGGLGEACLGFAHALAKKGAKVTFVLPKKQDLKFDFMDLLFANVEEKGIDLLQSVYTTYETWLREKKYRIHDCPSSYISGALKYAERIREIAIKVAPDVIHAHDWLTFPAAVEAKRVTGAPLVVHVHSTEFDRTGGNYPNEMVYNIEKEGLEKAEKVIAISKLQRDIISKYYGIDKAKIDIVYNGPAQFEKKNLEPALEYYKNLGYKIVLYLGRITLQKGPEYFVRAAKKVLDYEKKVLFVVTGDGDMLSKMLNETVSLGIMNNFVFTGFLQGDEKHRIYQTADLYVMPSVSEPFGLTALESIDNGTPVLISKQSGVSEILNNALKTDFWDVDEMANMIITSLHYPAILKDLINESAKEMPNFSWDNSVDKCIGIYNQLLPSSKG